MNTSTAIALHFKDSLQKLETVFVYYSSLADQDCYNSLKSKNYRRMIEDLQIVYDHSMLYAYELALYAGKNSTGFLSFEVFLEKLPNIALIAYKNQTGKVALQKLVFNNFLPLYEFILEETPFGKQLGQLKLEYFSECAFSLLKKYENTLEAIYDNYFASTNKKPSKEQQFAMVSKMSYQLRIVPYLFRKSINYLIFSFLIALKSRCAFQQLFSRKDISVFPRCQFDFFNFMLYLIIASNMNQTQIDTQSLNQSEDAKLMALLQYIELSDGFKDITSKKRIPLLFIQHSGQTQKKLVDKKKTVDNNRKGIKHILEDNYEPLRLKFSKLSNNPPSDIEPTIETKTAHKLLESSCPQLAPNTIDLIIAASGKLTFDAFVKLLSQASSRSGISLPNLVNEVLLYKAGQFSISAIFDNLKLEQRQYDTIAQILQTVENYLRCLFDHYAQNGYMSLNSYLRFFYESNTTHLVDRNQLIDIFEECSSGEKSGKMCFGEFKSGFSLISLSISSEVQLYPPAKLIYLLDRISESKKCQSIYHYTRIPKEDPLYRLRIKFSDIYKQIVSKLSGSQGDMQHKNMLFI